MLHYRIQDSVFNQKRNVYISGPGGTGKSFAMNLIFEEAKKLGINVAMCSTTGVSSFNIGGKTIHSWSGVLLPNNFEKMSEESQDKAIDSILKKTGSGKYKERWQDTKLLLIDEVSMLGAMYLEVLDLVARTRRGTKVGRKNVPSSEPFGGLQVVFSGDMLQLPPCKDSFVFESEVWDSLNLECFVLTRAYRFDNQSWTDLLNRARMGDLNKEDIRLLSTRCRSNADSTQHYIKFMPLNRDVDVVNNEELDRIESKLFEIHAEDYQVRIKGHVLRDDIIRTPEPVDTESFNKIFPICEVLYLKVGARVMLRYNLDVEAGLVNGTVGVVKAIEGEGIDTTVEVEFENAGSTEIVAMAFTDEEEDGNEVITRSRKQLPLSLAYASSIHKSQGLTFAHIEVDIGNNIFSPGQAYVAISRCKTLEGLSLTSFNPSKVYADGKAKRFETAMKKAAVFLD